MVARDADRAEMADALADSAAGRGRVVVLLGEAGIGKSTLAGWAVEEARTAGVEVAAGACSAAGMPALWPLRQALADVAPGLRWHDDSGATAGSDRELFAAAIVEAISTATRERPLFILLEDLHWADVASLHVIRAIADAIPALRTLMVLTVRDDPGELTPQVREQLLDLPTHARRTVLAPLDDAATADLATQVLDRALPAEEIGELRRRTGGNPFFVHEVLRLQAAHGARAALVVPAGVRAVIQRRVARVSQRCAALLGVAAIAAETCAGLIERDVLDDTDAPALLAEAADARLIDDLPDGPVFRHALIHESIEADLSASERARLHGLVAARLERRDDAQPAARLAHHWARASGELADERAAHWSLVAARTAVAEFGFEAATEHFRRALTTASTDRIGVSIELGAAMQLSGDLEGARTLLLAAARQAEQADRPVEFARAALALGGGLAGFEVPIADDLQWALLARADELLPDSERAWRAAVRGRLSLARAGVMPLTQRIAMAEDAVRLARDADEPTVESAALAAYCDAIAGPEFVSERITAAQRMVALTDTRTSLHQQTTLLLARRLLLLARLESGDLAAAEAQAFSYEQVANLLGIPLYGWLPEIWRGMRALLIGDTDAALRRAAAAEQIGRRAHSFNAELMALTLRMQAHLERGTTEEYAPTVREIVDQIVPGGMPAMYLAGPARFLLAAGDTGPARTVLRALGAGDPAAMPKDAEWLEAHWAMADIAIALDDRTAAAQLYDALRPYAHLWAVDGIGGAVFGAVAEQLGRLAQYLGRGEEADALLRTAREQYERQGTPALLRRLEDTTTDRPAPARIHRAGVTWQLDWHGRRSTVPDAKGLHDLAVLLARPDQPVPAVDLVAAGGGPSAAEIGGPLGPVLDDTARRAYRNRLADLERELAEAEDAADLARAEQVRAERTMLVDELAAAVGLGGRARIAGDPAERARKAVTMRIRAAIRTIEEQDAALARHLTNAVRTGRLCSYEPDVPVHWQT
jgi:hypothetical protein